MTSLYHKDQPSLRALLVILQADALLKEARSKYESGDRMTAMRLFEKTLEQVNLMSSTWLVNPGPSPTYCWFIPHLSCFHAYAGEKPFPCCRQGPYPCLNDWLGTQVAHELLLMAVTGIHAFLLLQDSLQASQRLSAMWGQLAVHASFGDVELAQMTLRGVALLLSGALT